MPGTCMFVWECLKTEGLSYFCFLLIIILSAAGQHLGMCMDGFMFGSCCVHDTKENMINDKHTSTSKVINDETSEVQTNLEMEYYHYKICSERNSH